MTGLVQRRVESSLFRVTSFGDIEQQPCKVWTIRNTLGAGEVTVWYGHPGSGKSVLLSDAAAHLAAGRSWFGRDVRQGAVLYVAAERGALVRRRLRAWAIHHDVADVPLAVVEGAIDLFSSPAHAIELIRIGRDLGTLPEIAVAWVIIDTKAQVMGGGDPNSDTDTLRMFANVRRIQDGLGEPHVTLADHTPYSAPDRIKGSGALVGAIDGSFLIRRQGAVRTMEIGSKPPNDGPEEFSITFTLASVEIGRDADNGGIATTAPIVVPNESASAGQTATRRSSLKPAGQKVFAAFGRLDDAGRTYPAPNVPGVRPGARAVMLNDLREMALSLGVFPEPEPTDQAERTRWRNGRNQAWRRGLQETQAAGLLRLENEFVWEHWPRTPVTGAVTNGDQW